MTDIDILLCYRGRYRPQVERLDALLEGRHLQVTFDREILSANPDPGDVEVEWMSMGSASTGESRTWRGPLSTAVDRSALVVFLINPRDPSVNVMNEIGWAARAGKPLFIVFDTESDAASEEWEGLNVGWLQAFYGMMTGKPVAPTFGYHFVTHRPDDALDQRLTILANRIVSYLDQVKRGEVGQVALSNTTTMSDVKASPPARARRRLQDVQEKLGKAAGVRAPVVPGDPLQNVLALLHARERDGVIRDGRIVPQGSPFTYPEASERERYRRTEAIVNLIRPGPYEIPQFLSMLARELASIEMVLECPLRPAVLVGTVPACPSNLPVDVLLDPAYAVLLVDATLLDFTYQMLKAAVLAWKITSPPGRLPVSMSTKLEDTRAVIAGSPGLVAGFARSVSQMITRGTPGASTPASPPIEYHAAISMLGVFQKRFSLAVTLARVALLSPEGRALLAQCARDAGAPPRPPTPADVIVVADALAAGWVFGSARTLDCVDPTITFQGILLALASQSLIERALSPDHLPEIVPALTRIERLTDYFISGLVEAGMPRADAQARCKGSLDLAATMDLLWESAVAAGALDPAKLKLAPRWRRNLIAR